MNRLSLIMLGFLAVGAVVGWLIYHSWWTPLIGAALAAATVIGLFLWIMSQTDIG